MCVWGDGVHVWVMACMCGYGGDVRGDVVVTVCMCVVVVCMCEVTVCKKQCPYYSRNLSAPWQLIGSRQL